MTMDSIIVKGLWYPRGAPTLPGETAEVWTQRMLGAEGEDRRPYDHRRNRQCSIGWHNECSDRQHLGVTNKAEGCGCPCHEERLYAAARVAEWNASVPVGTVVSFVEANPPEPPVATTGLAYVAAAGRYTGWPVVDLATFDHAVWLSWLVKP